MGVQMKVPRWLYCMKRFWNWRLRIGRDSSLDYKLVITVCYIETDCFDSSIIFSNEIGVYAVSLKQFNCTF